MMDRTTRRAIGERVTPLHAPKSTPWPQLDAEAANLTRLHTELREAQDAAGNAKQAQRAAVEKDRRALAKAMREGKPEPKESAVAKADAALAAAERRREALQLAVDEQEDRILALVEENRDVWAADVDRAQEKVRERQRRALDEIRAAANDAADVGRLRAFLERPDGKGAAATWNPHVSGLVGRSGEPYHLGDVVDALSATVDPPATPEAPEGTPFAPRPTVYAA